MSLRLGIDIGGTFTDFVLLSSEGEVTTAKVLSNHDDLISVIGEGLTHLADCRDQDVASLLASIELIIHGTTIATNALIQHNLAKVGMITTAGFRDILEMREGLKESRYDYKVPPPIPLVPRRLRLPVSERVNKAGAVQEQLNEDEVTEAFEQFARAGVEAVAVCLLWSIVNPANEQRVGELLAQMSPDLPVYLSSTVSPQFREYPRFSTTALCAALSTKLMSYVDTLEDNLRSIGFDKAIRYIQCNGGTTSGSLLKERPVLALDSGPAAGPAAGLFFSRQFDTENVVVIDMGGTSLDVSLVKNGQVETATNVDVHRYRVNLPMVNVRTIGAGGGSIGWIDDAGMLLVGPQSAESNPGPACYGRGGEQPTVTDANVALGYFSSDSLLGGRMSIDGIKSLEVIEQKIAKPLGIDVHEAAHGIFTVVNENMANAVRQISTERGYDIRDFSFVCGGGCSPTHAARIAESVGVETVIIPRVSSLLCSFGASITDVRHDYARNDIAMFANCDVNAISLKFDDMCAEAVSDLETEGFSGDFVELRRTMEVRYSGEIGELTIDVSDVDFANQGMDAVAARFHSEHESTYTFADYDSPCELMGLGVTAHGLRSRPLTRVHPRETAVIKTTESVVSERHAWFDGEKSVPIDIHDGATVEIGAEINGPAVIEEETTTILVPPSWHLRLTDRHAWMMTRGTNN
jgi:N-methylhydantoinase A